jgi:DNA-binding NtrC family response regulator
MDPASFLVPRLGCELSSPITCLSSVFQMLRIIFVLPSYSVISNASTSIRGMCRRQKKVQNLKKRGGHGFGNGPNKKKGMVASGLKGNLRVRGGEVQRLRAAIRCWKDLRTGTNLGGSMEDFDALNLVGNSPALLHVLELTKRFAGCNATVLLQGETGTGKELVARAIHYLGARRDFPFIPVNCGALPDSLVERELFGHARGAFTDARDAKPGLIAEAQAGTLFLDEIEVLTPKAQVALLRFLQDLEYRPLGGVVVRDCNVRIIAASNANLGKLATDGHFRRDLLFRLDVLSIDLPPLRERRHDVVTLAEKFLTRFGRQYRRPKTLHPDAVARLLGHDWPGNVRELENLIHREFLMTDGPTIDLQCLAPRDPGREENRDAASSRLTASRFQEAKGCAIANFERAYIVELLSRTRGNISQAARIAGKERSRLGKLAKKYGLGRASFTREAGTT